MARDHGVYAGVSPEEYRRAFERSRELDQAIKRDMPEVWDSILRERAELDAWYEAWRAEHDPGPVGELPEHRPGGGDVPVRSV